MGYTIKEEAAIKVKNDGNAMKIDGKQLNNASLIIRAIKHPLRKEIIELIDAKGALTVTEIFISLRIEQSVASQHLAVLREADWLETKRQGKYVFYNVNYQRFEQLNAVLELLSE